MDPYEISLIGYLLKNGEKIPAEVARKSRYSLHVKFLASRTFEDNARFEGMVLHIINQDMEFGICRFVREAEDDYDGTLIFLDGVYDFQALFYEKRIIDFQLAFYNLPLILSQKNKITASFKDYVANLTYDLKVYKHFFDDLDAKLQSEEEQVRDEVRRIAIEKEGRKFMEFFDARLADLEREVAEFNKERHEHHGYYFRKQVWEFIMCSALMTRTNMKPRGFSGDSEIMRMIHENKYVGNSIFSMLMHKHPLETRAGDALRNRRFMTARALDNVRKDFPGLGPGGFRFLSVACGSSPEVPDLFLSPEDCETTECSFLDHDNIALDEARQRVTEVEQKYGRKIRANYLHASVRTMLQIPGLPESYGNFQFIYCMGLLDYTTPPVARAMIEKMYQLLVPGGQLLIGNFHVNNPDRFYLEYWCDWVIYCRTEEELIDLMNNNGRAETMVTFDETGIQMYLHVRKPL